MNLSEGAHFSLNVSSRTSTPVQVITGVTVVVLTCLGLVLNVFILHIFRKNRHLQTPTNFFIIALASNDIVMIITGMPVVAANCFSGAWMFGPLMCVVYAFLSTVSGVTSVGILTAIALDRFFIVTKSNVAKMFSATKVLLVIAVCVAHALLWGVLPLLGWGGYMVEINGVSCGPDWQNLAGTSRSYNVAILACVFVLPIGVIGYCYGKIILLTRSNRVLVANAGQMSACTVREVKVAIAAFYLIGAFILAWSPYAFLSIWTMLNDPSSLPEAVAVLPPLLAKSASAWNPLIYVARNQDFRRAFLLSMARSNPSINRRIPQNRTVVATRVVMRPAETSC